MTRFSETTLKESLATIKEAQETILLGAQATLKRFIQMNSNGHFPSGEKSIAEQMGENYERKS